VEAQTWTRESCAKGKSLWQKRERDGSPIRKRDEEHPRRQKEGDWEIYPGLSKRNQFSSKVDGLFEMLPGTLKRR